MASAKTETTEERCPSPRGDQTEEGAEPQTKTVAPDALIKHPLQSKWALWFFKLDKTKDWADNLKVITSFDTVEDFWALYNHVQKASKLPTNCDYSLFKEGIEPMWEDEQNKEGGRWLINLDRKQRTTDLDNVWLETLLCLIGEAFEEFSDEVNGAVVNIRNKGDKLSLWTKDFRKSDATMKVGRNTIGLIQILPFVQRGSQRRVTARERHMETQFQNTDLQQKIASRYNVNARMYFSLNEQLPLNG